MLPTGSDKGCTVPRMEALKIVGGAILGLLMPAGVLVVGFALFAGIFGA